MYESDKDRYRMNTKRVFGAIALLLSSAGCGLPGYDSVTPGVTNGFAVSDTATYEEALADRPITYEPALVNITPPVVRLQSEFARATHPPSPSLKKITSTEPVPQDYRIGAGDIIHVVVFGHPELTTPGSAAPDQGASWDIMSAIDPISIDFSSFGRDDTQPRNDDGAGLGSVLNPGNAGYNEGSSVDFSAPEPAASSPAGAVEIQRRNAANSDLNRYLGSSLPDQPADAQRDQLSGAQGSRSSSSNTQGQSQTALGQLVDADGEIYYPYVGTVQAAGLTRRELREKITAGLSGYIRQPQVDIRILEYRSKEIFIYGDIPKPCVIPFTDLGITVIEALERCGGFTAANRSLSQQIASESRTASSEGKSRLEESNAQLWGAPNLSSIVLIRNGESTTLNLFDLYRDGRSVPMEAGDRLLIGDSASRVYLIGEFRQQLAIPHGVGRLALIDAVAAAGGVSPETGQNTEIYVFRRLVGAEQIQDTNGESIILRPLVYRLETNVPQSLLLASQFYLKPNDVVYAAPARAANFNRALTLLTPSLDQLFTSFLYYDRLR